MIFHETKLSGAFVVELEPHADARGFFARSFCREEFAEHGLAHEWVQSNVSFNRARGTLRGMHWQIEPHAEVKLVRCTAGAIFDVIVDLRPDSPSLGQWVGIDLTASNRLALYVPRGLAHGFVSLADDTEVFYEMSTPHAPAAARGFCWDDPRIGIEWPESPGTLSERDADYDALPEDLTHAGRRASEPR